MMFEEATICEYGGHIIVLTWKPDVVLTWGTIKRGKGDLRE